MDIGKSTTSHSVQTQEGRNVDRLLRNWGDWQSSIEEPSPSEYGLQPMFKEYVAGYRDGLKPRYFAENVDAAERLDRTLAAILCERDILVIYCHYACNLSSREAAKVMTAVERKKQRRSIGRKDKLSCTNRTFTSWLEVAVTNVETALTFAEGYDF